MAQRLLTISFHPNAPKSDRPARSPDLPEKRCGYGVITAMYFNGFFTSFYINRDTPSHRRATVLSFKGLSCNLAYGLFGTGYALVLKSMKVAAAPGGGQALDNLIFKESFTIIPAGFPAGLALLLLIAPRRR